MTESIAELQAQAKQLEPEIVRIKRTLLDISRNEQVNDRPVTNAATNLGYIRWSTRAKRFMLTDKGKAFVKAMKRFG